jgi:hypothetical protein
VSWAVLRRKRINDNAWWVGGCSGGARRVWIGWVGGADAGRSACIWVLFGWSLVWFGGMEFACIQGLDGWMIKQSLNANKI